MRALVLALCIFVSASVYAQTQSNGLAVCFSLTGIAQQIGSTLNDQCRTCVCACLEYATNPLNQQRTCIRAGWSNCTTTSSAGNCVPPLYTCFDDIASVARLPNETWSRDLCTKCQCTFDVRNNQASINCTTDLTNPSACSSTKPELCYRRNLTGSPDQGWEIGSQYEELCTVCRCERPSPLLPAGWRCIPSATAGNCPTLPSLPKCVLNGVSYNLGDVLSLPCQKCVCVAESLTNIANFSCSPIDSTLASVVGTGCTPAPVRCAIGSLVYAVGQTFQDSTGCRNCTCTANGLVGVVNCVTSGSCGTIPPIPTSGTCSAGDTILKVGEQASFGCRVCTCSYACTGVATSTNVACDVQLSCILNVSNPLCLPQTTCVATSNVSYAVGQLWMKDKCTACTCDTNGWICRPLLTGSCNISVGTENPTCKALDGTVYQLNATVRFSQCEICTCVTANVGSGLAGAAWACIKDVACPTSGGTTAPPPSPTTDGSIGFCYDNSGKKYLAGTYGPSSDGCSYCRCGYEYTNGTRSSEPTWICNPTYGQENSRCCNISGVVIRPGSFAIDRVACKNCTCNENGLSCTALSLCSVCTFNGNKYVQGEVRKNDNGCGYCRCSQNANGQPAWECETRPCDRFCVRLNVTVVLSAADAHYNQNTITLILNAILGAGNYSVYVASNPDSTTIIIQIRCLDGIGAAVDVQAEVEAGIKKSFSRDGQAQEADCSSSIQDPGTAASEQSTGTSSSSIISVSIVSCLVLMFVALLF